MLQIKIKNLPLLVFLAWIAWQNTIRMFPIYMEPIFCRKKNILLFSLYSVGKKLLGDQNIPFLFISDIIIIGKKSWSLIIENNILINFTSIPACSGEHSFSHSFRHSNVPLSSIHSFVGQIKIFLFFHNQKTHLFPGVRWDSRNPPG